MKVKMKKIMFIMLAGLLVLSVSLPIRGDDHDKYGDSDRYRYQGSNYNGYSSNHDYKSKYSRHDDRGYKDYRGINKEIDRNERRIRKLEKKIKKYYRKRYRCSRSEYSNYTIRIRELEWEISRLVERNRHLRRSLRH